MSNTGKKTEKITIWGIVQGVGFRPFVTKLAGKMNIDGSIINMGGFVQLIISGEASRTDLFLERIQREKPTASEIVRVQREEIPFVKMEGFTIEESEIKNDEIGMIPADMAICDDCLAEFYDPANPRYKHPFISCTVCGPRYTIIDSLPYDRENTTMRDFSMCDFCNDQYNDKDGRRFHSQTISCHDCGPMAEFHGRDGVISEQYYFGDDEVIALKGTGGYYFVCSPFSEKAVRDLRDIKVREEKPFAVMFKDMESIREYCIAGSEEEMLLTSSKRPIVLLEKKDDIKEPLMVEGVCRSSRYIGAFLPSFGLQYLLIDKKGPLIMTSANLSDLPIIYNDEEMLNLMKIQSKLVGVLLNKREIRMSLDDTVARVIDRQTQLTRRSKGYAPIPIYVKKPGGLDKTHQMVAVGGQLKSAFSLSKGNFSYVSQYFGDLDSMESRSIYENNFHRMKKFFGIDPDMVLCDMHPLYHTTKYAEKYVEDENRLRPDDRKIELLKVQHHHAHIASVMAEHGLSGPVIGVSFDGTGYGTDGNIWGGEFLICHEEKFERFSHLKYVDMIGGDSSMKAGWKSAVSHIMAQTEDQADDNERILDIKEIIDYSIREKTLSEFRDIPTVEAAIKNKINTVKTSSTGRLFDGVASLLGIHHINRYEGECAIMLENAAYEASKHPGENKANDLALKFHIDVAKMILTECQRIRSEHRINNVALSGGVFQNKILMERTLELLRSEGFEVYYNSAVPTNDGGISLGQNFIGMHHMSKKRPAGGQEGK